MKQQDQRIFLGWSAPAVELLLDYLVRTTAENLRRGATWDLSKLIIVLPTGWAMRRFLAGLVSRAADRGLTLFPPETLTVGQLPERLYVPPARPANEPTCLLAWCAALQEMARHDEPQLQQIFPVWKISERRPRWLALAQLLHRLRHTLGTYYLDCETVSRSLQKQKTTDFETTRWQGLAALERRYLAVLAGLGRCDLSQARSAALKQQCVYVDRQILLVGLVDLAPITREMLRKVRDRVTVLIVAPAEFSQRFDDLGCLIPEAWQTLPLSVPEDRVMVCHQPMDQAQAVVQAIERLPAEIPLEEITVGAADESLVPFLLRCLKNRGVSARYGPGRSLLSSPPWLLLEAIAGFVRDLSPQAFATLVRHPHVETWIRTRRGVETSFLEILDEWIQKKLPLRMDDHTMAREVGAVKDVWELLWTRFSPEIWNRPQTVAECAERIREVLLEFFGKTTPLGSAPVDAEQDRNRAMEACRRLVEALDEWRRVPEALQTQLGWQPTPGELLEWLGRHLATERLAEPLVEPAVEIMGWLDVPWDDAPVTIVTSVNEGFIPSVVGSDMFLTHEVRTKLNLDDSARRRARDAYLLSLIIASRKICHLIVARQDTRGDPLLPSRFLFSAADEKLPGQVRTLFGLSETEGHIRTPFWENAAENDVALWPPQPRDVRNIRSISVTQFRDYLACPYRFYLRHVLKLTTVDDAVDELDPLGFGSLAHRVLFSFARSKLCESTDPDLIAELLIRSLEELVQQTFARLTRPAIRIQVELLKARLRAFAAFQAEHARQWQIVHAEYHPSQPIIWEVDGQPIEIVGRIDRIDRHRESGEFLILDYKVTEGTTSPEAAHRRREEQQKVWIDLQLPLYRHLVKDVVGEQTVKLGYILLPKDTEKTGLALAEWTEEDLRSADQTAREVIRQIRQGVFWPPNPEAEGRFPDLAPILP